MRELSYGEKDNGMFDKLLFFLRTRVITSKLKETTHVKAIIDLGSGYNGYFLSNIIDRFPDLEKAIGVDLSVNSKLDIRKITLISGNLNEKLPFADKTFDIVFSTAVLEHLENYDLALKEMYRILKTGGKACTIIGNTSLRGVEILNAQVAAEQMQAAGFKKVD